MVKIRTRSEQIRSYILDQVEESPEAVAKETAERFGISRQAANKHLRRLCKERILEQSGKTNATQYRLATLSSWTGRYEIQPKLTEEVVWTQDVQDQLGSLPDNVEGIWYHGFTEMFNNAIDHSDGSMIRVGITRTIVGIEMWIHDDGCGIFRKIQKALELPDERHAILELSKGKLTTDPDRHTGEGIFFTSRMFDEFAIFSGGIYFSHEFGKKEDWVLETDQDLGETSVFMKLKNTTKRAKKEIFDRFTSGEDFGFTKTIIPVRMVQLGEDELISRSQAKRLLTRVEKFQKVLFDFQGVKDIGPAFADEIFRVFARQHPEIELAPINTGPETEKMIARAVNVEAHVVSGSPTVNVQVEVVPLEAGPPLSEASIKIQEYVSQSIGARKPVGYDPSFLLSYQPNDTFYLSQAEREHLWETGQSGESGQPAGIHAKNILDRLLIDLSWNSSRLEGNTYSLLETSRLLELGEEAEGKKRSETQMILNHKDAIEFLVEAVEHIGFNRHTLLNLHALLANNLLPDPDAEGRLRHASVGIGGSVFHPLETPQLIEEHFDRILATASAIEDPFERAFFAMVQIPYLQAFDDVNKRVSRLAVNISLIQSNLSPLSFEDVSRRLYTGAVLGVYELNRVELLKDVFLWAYQRSAVRYAAIRQSIGEPDPFRMRHRTALREVVGMVVRQRMNKQQAATHVHTWAQTQVDEPEYSRFCEIAEKILLGLHEGNVAPYRIRLSEFTAWQERWGT
ncbi:MAG: DUF4325 domain-containing protein [Gammaproteobacteria bacterium]|nr:DUF4325 domain-containing protein [Gammaproteobacteria bacterium]